MSEGSSNAVYLADYLGWSNDRIERAYRRSRRFSGRGVHDRLLALEKVTRAYVFSDWARDVTSAGADPEKLEVIPPGFVTPAAPSGGSPTRSHFLFVGTDFERKGGFDVVEAFDLIRQEQPHVRLVLAGSDPAERNPDRAVHSWVGEQRRTRLLARLDELERLGVASRFAGKCRRSAALVCRGGRVCDATLAEGFGFTNVEAMSYGLPVVSSEVGPIPETVLHEESGLVVAPGDVEALVEAMSGSQRTPRRPVEWAPPDGIGPSIGLRSSASESD